VVRNANSSAAVADQRAYFAASLLFMISVKQNSSELYRKAAASDERWGLVRATAGGTHVLVLLSGSPDRVPELF
jgi:hypothetical protein